MRCVACVLPRAFSRYGRRLWLLGLCAMLALLVTGCRSEPPPPMAPSTLHEPPFLPSLPLARLTASPVEQQRLFATAEALRSSRQYIQARQTFNDFVQRFSGSLLAGEALLALGHISLTLEQYSQAAPYYRLLLERFPDAAHRPEAYLGLGIALYHQQDYVSSLPAARQYLTRLPPGANQAVALYYVGAALLKLQQYVEGIATLKNATAASSVPALTERARGLIASTIQEQLTVETLQELARQYPNTYPGDLVLERLVQEQRKRGNVMAETEALQHLINGFAQAPSLPEARTRLQSLQSLQTQLPAEEFKLGVLFPLSGPGGKAGLRALRGVELALAMFQEQAPELKLSLATRDATQDTATARAALRTLVHSDRVIGVIGPLLSRTATDLVPLVEQLRVPLLSPYARDSNFPALSTYAFRNSLTDAMQVRFLVEYAIRTLKLRRFVILHPDGPYGTDLRDRFQEQVQQRRGELVAVIAYRAKSGDIRRALAPLKGLQYDAIFLPEYAENVRTIVRQLVAEGVKVGQLLGSDTWNAPALVSQDTRLLEGAVFVDGFFAQSSAPLVKTFVEEFQARYHETPDLLAAQAYDALVLCAQVLKAGARTPAQLRDGLIRVQNFAGVSGRTSMGASRDAEKIPYFLTVQRGQIVELNVSFTAGRR